MRRKRQRVYNRSDYILRDVIRGRTTTGKYVAPGGRYTTNINQAAVFSGAHLNDVLTINYRPWRENFRAIEEK